MVMPKKKRTTIIIMSVLMLLIVIVAILAILYLKTDMFKSNSTLFAKYLMLNTKEIENLSKTNSNLEEFNNLLENNKYQQNIEAKVSYVKNISTSEENRDNSVNKLKLVVNGQTDKQNQFDYKNIKLYDEDKEKAELEYLKNQTDESIRFTNRIKQFLTLDNANVEEILKRVGIDVDGLIEFSSEIDLNSLFLFTEEENEKLRVTYSKIITDNVSESNFQKEKSKMITVNKKEFTTNMYSIKLTKEQMSSLYVKILEQVKQDEIVLNKINEFKKIQKRIGILSGSQIDEEQIEQETIEQIEALIKEIEDNSIGKEEIKICVYENNGKTLRTTIESNEYKIYIDMLEQSSTYFNSLTIQQAEKSMVISMNKEFLDDGTNIVINIDETVGTDIFNTTLEYASKLGNNDITKNILINVQDENNKFEFTVKDYINMVNMFDKNSDLESNNIIDIDNLQSNKIEMIKEVVQKFKNDIALSVNNEDISEIGKFLGLANEESKIGSANDENTMTQTEIFRFNSKFEFYITEEASLDIVKELLEEVQKNLKTVSMKENPKSDTNEKENIQFTFNIEKDSTNDEEYEEVMKVLEDEKNKNCKCSIEIEYDSETNIVNNIIITMYK